MQMSLFFSRLTHIKQRKQRTHISLVDIVVTPTAQAFSLPSTKICCEFTFDAQRGEPTTTAPLSTSSIAPPSEVRPGHMTLEPLRMNFKAPLSTCIRDIIVGSESNSCRNGRKTYIYEPNEAMESMVHHVSGRRRSLLQPLKA